MTEGNRTEWLVYRTELTQEMLRVDGRESWDIGGGKKTLL